MVVDSRAIFNLGFACNNCCIMCTYRLPEETYMVSFEEAKSMINNLGDVDGNVIMTGGEPTIRKDFFEILDYIGERHPDNDIHLSTNATTFGDPEFTKRVARYPKVYVTTEFHGSTSEKHDAITRTKGSFKRTYDGIKNMLKYGVKFQIREVIHKVNYQDLPTIAKFLVKEFPELRKTVIFTIDLIGNAKRNLDTVFVMNSKIIPFVEEATDIFEKHNVEVSYFQIPCCMLKKKYRYKVVPNNVSSDRIYFDKKCDACSYRNKCSGVWRTYAEKAGVDELKPIP